MSSADQGLPSATASEETRTHPTDATPRDNAPMTAGPLFAVWTALGLAVAIVLLGVRYQGLLPPLRGRESADAMTNHVTGLVDLAAQVSMLATFAFLLAGTFYSVGVRRHHELSEQGRQLVRRAGLSAGVWFSCSLLMIPLTAGENNGVSLATALQGLRPFVAATQPAQAWIIPAVIALVITVSARRIRRVGAPLALLLVGLIWQLAPVVAGNVSVGADHDFGTDAAIWASMAACIALASAAAALFTMGREPSASDDTDRRGTGGNDRIRSRRYLWTLAIAGTVVVAGRVVVAWFELAGTSPLASGYGLVTLLLIAGWIILALRGWAGLALGVRSRGGIAADLALGIILVGLLTVMGHMAPPRFLAPQGSAQINYLGYEVNQLPTLEALLLPGRPNLLLVVLAVTAIVVYAAGLITLVRRRIRWPIGRAVAWFIGWSLLLWIATSGLWAYSGAAFSYHMLVHMTLAMLVPVLVVLGAPITLALRVLPILPESRPMGARDLLNGLVNWKPLEYVLHPVVIGLNFISATYLIYLTGLFDFLMRYHWGHQLMTVHFLMSGLLFYGQIIGADRNPRELPHVAKLGFLFAAMPFHAFFAVTVLSSDGIIGGNFYRSIDVAWMTDLAADQQLGGQFTWALGEIPMLIVILALIVQWFTQDSRDARRQDRAMDEGLDDSYEAYNEMLRKLSQRADR